jgi:hypothetical protein
LDIAQPPSLALVDVLEKLHVLEIQHVPVRRKGTSRDCSRDLLAAKPRLTAPRNFCRLSLPRLLAGGS